LVRSHEYFRAFSNLDTECSGLHRSLGTHVSKIRSLTLDTVSFTPDMVELLCNLGNKISNAVWEATCDSNQRPDPRATREVRLKYITQKYVDRAFVEPLSTTLSPYASPNEQLVDAVRKGDFFLALQAIALKADPNVFDTRTSQTVVLLALSLADRVPPSTPTTPTAAFNEQGSTASPVNTTYPMAEFLIQNGADIPEDPQHLSMQARTFLQQKVAKRLGLNSLNTSNSTVTSSILQHNQDSPPSVRGRFPQNSHTTSPQEKKEKEKERLAKRVSSGSRLMRAPQLDKS
jgi:Arf-GAP with SH3 domain, ANK repeat and PH domain-containing protein